MLSFQKCGQSMWNWVMAKSMDVTLWWAQQASSHVPKCSFRTIRWVRQHLLCLGCLHDFGLVEKHKQPNVFFRFCVWWRWQSRPSSQFFPLQLSAAVRSCMSLAGLLNHLYWLLMYSILCLPLALCPLMFPSITFI